MPAVLLLAIHALNASAIYDDTDSYILSLISEAPQVERRLLCSLRVLGNNVHFHSSLVMLWLFLTLFIFKDAWGCRTPTQSVCTLATMPTRPKGRPTEEVTLETKQFRSPSDIRDALRISDVSQLTASKLQGCYYAFDIRNSYES